MIEAFSLKTAHYYGDALASQARLRHRVFVEHRALAHASYDGMEYDEFDTPATVYLVWRDPKEVVRGLIRLIPTSVSYMLEQYWPYLCQRRDLPKNNDVWECSRVCVDRAYDSKVRPAIMPQLLCAVQDFCRDNDARAVIGVTRQHLLEHFFPKKIDWLGEPAEVEGELEAAFWIATENMRPDAHCAKYGLPNRLLMPDPLSQRIAA
jgi:N-acyl-L-homoserine lactone synthetase